MRIALIILLLIAGVGYLYQHERARPSKVTEPNRYPADHIIHITAKLEFDGKPVVIDDLIDCLAEGRGTPTQSPHLTFRLSRNEIVAEVPGGGAIVIPTSLQMCYAYGNTWGDALEEFTVPDGWTPVIQWFDHRDPREAQEGIMYLSETALNAENGRLKIVEDFQLVIPEHPASDALVAEAERQVEERDYWMNDPDARRPGIVGSMVEIPESMWRHPDPMFARTSVHQSDDTDFYPMIEYLDELIRENGNQGLLSLGWSNEIANQDAVSGIGVLIHGRVSGRGGFYEWGIPRMNLERLGLLISTKAAAEFETSPIALTRYDERVPWRCDEGVATPDFDNRGMVYFYRDRCIHPDHYQAAFWPNRQIIGDWNPSGGDLLFDLETHSIWFLSIWN